MDNTTYNNVHEAGSFTDSCIQKLKRLFLVFRVCGTPSPLPSARCQLSGVKVINLTVSELSAHGGGGSCVAAR